MIESTTIPDRVGRWLPEAQASGMVWQLDYLDLLAVCDRESNGDPNAHSPDGGLGLMQITERYHPTFCAAVGPDGKPLWRVPAWNLFYGGALLRQCMNLFDGTGYNARLCGIASYNASHRRVREVIRKLTLPVIDDRLISELDPLTTDANYVSDVLRRRAGYVLR